MRTVILRPIQDVGPNDYAPTPSGAHFLNVDEDPHDGDATMLVTSVGREVWRLGVNAIPDGATVVSVRIRSAQKQSTAGGNTYRVGFRIMDVDYPEPNHVLGTGSSYVSANDEAPVDPSDGEAWTKERLARAFLEHEQIAQAVGLPRPRLTQCIVLADIIDPPDRPQARAQGAGGVAAGSSGAPGGRAASSSPAAMARSGAPGAIAGSSAPAGTTTSTSPRGATSSRAPAAVPTEAEIARLKARVSTSAPRAVVSSPAPASQVSSPAPPGEAA